MIFRGIKTLFILEVTMLNLKIAIGEFGISGISENCPMHLKMMHGWIYVCVC